MKREHLARGVSGLLVLTSLICSRNVLPYGEQENGFPNWQERMIHVLTNRARCDPAADLADCDVCADRDCYSVQPPVMYDYNLNRAARFHAANQPSCGCGLAHDSPCTLVDGIGTLYDPGSCDGSSSCACEGGSCPCSGTSWSDRVSSFGTSPSGENIAMGYTTVLSVFYAWLHEPDSDSSCGFRPENGHRYNILSGHGKIGVGYQQYWWGQDFGGGSPTQKIASGAHYPNATGAEVEFRANWYDAAAPGSAMVNIDGTCHQMELERGTDRNGTFLYTGPVEATCTRYYFMFEDSEETPIIYPDTGSFGVGESCPDWESTRPSVGSTCGADYSGTVTGGCSCSIVH